MVALQHFLHVKISVLFFSSDGGADPDDSLDTLGSFRLHIEVSTAAAAKFFLFCNNFSWPFRCKKYHLVK
jgi:hypothetical protein